MSPVADNPVIIRAREQNPCASEPTRIRCPLCGWSRRKEDKWVTPRRFFDGPGLDNFDMAPEKSMEAFNVFNHAQFYGSAAVTGNISSANFGQVVSATAPRLVQLVAKFTF